MDLLCERFPGENILIEKFLAGREFTIGVIGSGEKARVIGALEIISKEKDTNFMTHSFKNDDDWEDHMAEIHADMIKDKEVKDACDVALRVYKEIGCRDSGRVDVRSDRKGEGAIPHFMEINPVAGLRPGYSQLPHLALNNGISYVNLIDDIIKSAVERYIKKQ